VKRIIPLCLLCIAFGNTTLAQDVSGFWKGTFRMQGCFTSNNIELQINMAGSVASGDSYHYQDINNYVKKNFTGSFNAAEKKLIVQEGMVTTVQIPDRCIVCVKQFVLQYSREGNLEILKGTWSGNVVNSIAICSGDSIILTRVKESAFKEIPEIKVDTGIIRLDFYDNAEIDGDSITVLVNRMPVLSNQRLGLQPLTTYIQVDLANPFFEIEMIAENQGSIPPNTAVLIITAGENRHRLNLSSTEAKSAKVRIVYEAGAGKPKEPPKYSSR
jgi:hypothetical protein